MLNESKVLVTGANGFIGKNLIKMLKKRGIKPVKFKGDIVHLAALTSLPESIESPLDYFMTNELGTVAVLEMARKNRVKNLIFASSIAVKNPDNPYALSKLNAEKWCEMYSRLYNINIWILRIYNVYGEGGHGVINIFADQWLKGDKLTIHETGEQTRDFIHVNDICDGICKIVEMKTGTQTSINKIAELVRNAPRKKLEEIL